MNGIEAAFCGRVTSESIELKTSKTTKVWAVFNGAIGNNVQWARAHTWQRPPSAYENMADPASSFPRPFRVGGRWRYRRSDVERWLAEQAAAAQVRSLHPLRRGALEAVSA